MPKPMKMYSPSKMEGVSVLVDKVDDVIKLCKTMHSLPKGSVSVIDTECRNLLRVYDNEMLAIQFSYDGQTGYVIPFDHPQSPFNADDKMKIAKAMKWMFTEPTPNSVFWGFHHNQYDLHQIRRTFECEVLSGPNIDTEQLAHLLNENRIKGARDPECYYQGEKGLSMAVLARVYLGIELSEDDKKDRANIVRWPMDRFVQYSGKDTWVPWRIIQEQLAEAEADGYRRTLLKMVRWLMSPANLLVCEMEANGFAMDLQHMLRVRGAGSPLLAEKARLIELLKKSRYAQKANDVLVKRASRGNKLLFGGSPWRFSPSKDVHRRVLFYDIMDLEPVSFTEADPPKPKVDSAFYEEYGSWDADDEPQNEAAIVGDWVGIDKMLSSFIKNFYKLVDPDAGDPDMQPDGRVRTTVKLSATTSGRPAMQKPAMQQLPRGTNEWRKAVKNMFTVEKGNVLICADLKANEVRWGAINAGCKDLGKLFTDGVKAQKRFRRRANKLRGQDRKDYRKVLRLRPKAKYDKGTGAPSNPEAEKLEAIKTANKTVADILTAEKEATLRGDIHTQTAAEFYELELEKVPKEKRQETKSIIFGHIAARGVKAISEQIKKTEEETAEKIDAFNKRFPGLARYLRNCVINAEHVGFVEGPQGRRRRFSPMIWQDPENWVKAKARRQAQNNTIQGVASDACLIAAFRLLDYIREHSKNWRILNIVHDAIYIEAPLEEFAEVMSAVEWALTDGTMDYMKEHFGVEFVAPLEAEVEVGLSLGSTTVWNGTEPHVEVLGAMMKDEYQKKYGEKWEAPLAA